jgi:1-acyl-sn-glycerol-3-phosphate acyltransferase
MASNWVALNTYNQKLFNRTTFNVMSTGELSMNDWCLVLSNHQSWVDIVVLQRLLHGKVPFLKFFLKKELIFVPILGLAWWALDFPFMKRYSQAFLRKNPHLKGKDLETTQKACAKFKHKPVSIMSFIEGTRFTQEKHDKQQAQFDYLLRPKAGGIGFVHEIMGEYLTKFVNVTIHYPEGIPTFGDFLCGRIKTINVTIATSDIDPSLLGNYSTDKVFKRHFQQWVNQQWTDKDAMLTEYHRQD